VNHVVSDRRPPNQAHRIRNRSSQIFKASSAIRAQYRWCLTGTPIHNCLGDYGALLGFIGAPPFTIKALFDHWIAKPINQKQPHSLERLKRVILATCLRRTKDLINDKLQLPSRLEREEEIELDKPDRKLYDFFKGRTSSLVAAMFPTDTNSSAPPRQGNILALIGFLRLICNHGEKLLPPAAIKSWHNKDSSTIDQSVMSGDSRKCTKCKVDIDGLGFSDSGQFESPCLHVICGKCAISKDEDGSTLDMNHCPMCIGESAYASNDRLASPSSAMNDISIKDYYPSAKVRALLRNLRVEQLKSSSFKDKPVKRHETILLMEVK
jgi:hypothetical protein